MFRSICVPLDGSPFSEHALPLARAIARRSGATIDLALVHTPAIVSYVNGVPITNEEVDVERRAADQNYLQRTRTRLAARDALEVTITMLEGAVAPALAEHIAAGGHDLVVMTTHGRGGLARVWLGSTADALLRQIESALLLVRPRAEAVNLDAAPRVRRILIPLDGSALAEQALPAARKLGQALESSYTLLQVVEPSDLMEHGADADVSEIARSVTQHRFAAAREYLERAAERLNAESATVDTQISGVNPPAAAILGLARQHEMDLIAMATQGRGGLARVLLGSVADKVVRGAEVPVLVVRPRAR